MYAMMGFMLGTGETCPIIIFHLHYIYFFVTTGYYQIPEDQNHIQDRISTLFFSVAFLTFMSIAGFPARQKIQRISHTLPLF
jgi:hypothetical protein